MSDTLTEHWLSGILFYRPAVEDQRILNNCKLVIRQMSDVRGQISDGRCQMSNVKCGLRSGDACPPYETSAGGPTPCHAITVNAIQA